MGCVSMRPNVSSPSLLSERAQLKDDPDIPSGDIAAVLSALSKNVYVTQEVSWGSGEPIQPSEYTTSGDVQE